MVKGVEAGRFWLCMLAAGILGVGCLGCGSDQDTGTTASAPTLQRAEAAKPKIQRMGKVSSEIFNSGNPDFCEPEQPVRDFGLSELPPVREVPESAKELGHGAVTFSDRFRLRVTSEPDPFGYEFIEYPEADVHLDWTVTAQLWAIDRQGIALREVDRGELAVRRLAGARRPSIFLKPLENRRGFYRFDMQIANRGGKVIGSYGTYFKVVRPTSGLARLQLARDVLRPGQQLLSRIANYGSETITYGAFFAVQRLEDGKWSRASDLNPKYWDGWSAILGPGLVGKCSSLSIPLLTPPGRYRIVKPIGTERWSNGSKGIHLYAPFKVVGTRADIEL